MKDPRNGVPFEPYPKCLYAIDGRTIIVNDVEHERRMGSGWYDTPAKFPPPAPPVAAPVPERQLDAIAKISSHAEDTLRRFYAFPVKVVTVQILDLQTLDEVREAREMEELRPGGARKGVMQAVLARMEQLVPPSEAPDTPSD